MYIMKDVVKILAILFPFCEFVVALHFLDSRLLSDARIVPSHQREILAVGKVLHGTHAGLTYFGDTQNVADEIIITLPDIGEINFFKTSYHLIGPNNPESKGTFKVWNGNIEDQLAPFRTSYSSFVLYPTGELFCDVKLGARRFECKPCFPTDNGDLPSKSCVQVIESVPTYQRIPPMTIQKYHEQSEPSRMTAIDLQEVDDGSVIDFLFLYSPAAVEYYRSEDDLKAAISSAVASLNDVLSIHEIELTARVVAWKLIDYKETGSHLDSYSFVTEDKVVATTRSSIGADLVLFITTDNIAAYASTPNPANSTTFSNVFSILGASGLVNSYNLHFSLGSNLGCTFDFENSLKDKEVKYAYAYQSETCDFHTIMGYSCASSQQVAAFSTPLLFWEATKELYGNTETADCARVIVEYKKIVAQYMNSVIESTPIPTPVPTPVSTTHKFVEVYPYDGLPYTSKFVSVLEGQQFWIGNMMDAGFIEVMQRFARSIQHAEECIVSIDATNSGGRRDRSLQATGSVKVSYSISNIIGKSTTTEVSNTIFESSENGKLAEALVLSSSLFSVSNITTESNGEPIEEKAEKSFPLQIILICVGVLVVVLIGLLVYWKRASMTKLCGCFQ